MTPFRSLHNYAIFIYTLPQQFPSIIRSTLTLAQKGRLFAELTGGLIFSNAYQLGVYELLVWSEQELTIDAYSYEAWHDDEKIYWYDSQSHPKDPSLASTDPHHKHVPPNIKRNRIPAPGLTFLAPNFPFLIQELETLIEKTRNESTSPTTSA